MSYKNFELQLRKDLVDTDEKIDGAISLIAMASLRGIVEKTPVDEGRLVNNWITSVDRLNPTVINDVDRTKNQSITRGAPVIEGFDYKKNKMIIIQNNLPYANRIENGYSRVKAPQGMVAVTLREVRTIYREILI
tara:strand:- start:115 stop:519 length:405 start_codon:yes stop_codon:yes gene_type:complete